jgi:hypothetical protein
VAPAWTSRHDTFAGIRANISSGRIADSAVAGAATPYAAIKRLNFSTQRRIAS